MTIASQNIFFLQQALSLLAAVDDDLLSAGSTTSRGASAGAHLRHVLECYRCFLGGRESGRVDYDARQRERRIETCCEHAGAVIAEVISGLEAVSSEDTGAPLEVRVDAAAWRDPENTWSRSSVARELQFLLSHTVHHYALIAMILRGHGFEPGPDFGVAPSTLEHERATTPSGVPIEVGQAVAP